MYIQLSLNTHLYKTDTSVKRTPRAGPYLPYSLYLTLQNIDLVRTKNEALVLVENRSSCVAFINKK